jgi:hypothetical protein
LFILVRFVRSVLTRRFGMLRLCSTWPLCKATTIGCVPLRLGMAIASVDATMPLR